MTLLRVDAAAARIDTPIGMLRCVIGRSGIIDAHAKREGDGATPVGHWPVRGALLRPGRVPTPHTRLPWRWIRLDDGWSDDPVDPSYNRPVVHPTRFSAERLWRDDMLYDLILVLGYNDAPPVSGRGSAIFLHAAPPAGTTEGCVAIERAALIALLDKLAPGDGVEIG